MEKEKFLKKQLKLMDLKLLKERTERALLILKEKSLSTHWKIPLIKIRTR